VHGLTGWVRLRVAQVCGGCPPEWDDEERTIPEGELGYITQAGRYRCQACAEELLGICQLSYDAPPEGGPTPQPTLPGSERYDRPADFVTPGELLRRNHGRARAIARWQARHPRR